MDTQVNTLEYRGCRLPIYLDDYGQCLYTIFDGEHISFGTYNSDYAADAKYLIDRKLDDIELIQSGAMLEWFDNNGYRDIRLTYRGRTVKVWLVADEREVDLERVKSESGDIIETVKRVMR